MKETESVLRDRIVGWEKVRQGIFRERGLPARSHGLISALEARVPLSTPLLDRLEVRR